MTDSRPYGHNSTLRRGGPLRRTKPMKPKACGKVTHPSKAAADDHLRRVEASPAAVDAETLGVYWCGTCRGYHVGHAVGSKKFSGPRKRLRSRPRKRSAEAAAIVARGCELTRLLDFLRPRGWSGFKSSWKRHPEARTVDPHHVFDRHLGDHAWNVVAASRVAHEFVQSTRVGRLVCAWALHRRGDLARETIRAKHGRDPIGLIAVDLENSIFTGRCERLASALCGRYGL